MSKKHYAVCGLIIGTIVVILGTLVTSGAIGGNTVTAPAAPSLSILYKSGYASFGADFYTYVTNNAQAAADASRTIADNQNVIYGFLRSAFGIALIVFGLFMNCLFGCKYAEAKAEKNTTKEAASVADVVPDPSEAEIETEEETEEETVEDDPDETADDAAEETPEEAVSPSDGMAIEE